MSNNLFICGDDAYPPLMKQDIKLKHDFIVNRNSMVSDLAEIVAEYCSYL
jgi:hypothetical protein